MAKGADASSVGRIGERSASRRAFVIVNTIVLTLMTSVSLLPVINILAMSWSNNTSVTAGLVGLWPVGFTSTAYAYIFRNPQFFTSFSVSLQRVLVGVPLNMICITLIAYPLSRPREQFTARKYYVWYLIVTMLFSGGMVPTYLIVKATGIYDTIWALILPGAVPVFSMLILMNFFRDLPHELTEAAMIDGAGHVTVLLRLFLPLSKAALATLTLFCFVDHWNAWFDGMVYINKKGLKPLQTYLQSILVIPDIARMDAQERRLYFELNLRSVKAAQIFITMTPILILYPFLQKYFTKGIVLGSVKG